MPYKKRETSHHQPGDGTPLDDLLQSGDLTGLLAAYREQVEAMTGMTHEEEAALHAGALDRVAAMLDPAPPAVELHTPADAEAFLRQLLEQWGGHGHPHLSVSPEGVVVLDEDYDEKAVWLRGEDPTVDRACELVAGTLGEEFLLTR